MDPSFWLERWQHGKIGFHEGKPNALLVRHLDRLTGHRLLVPMCGKAEDLAFLAAQGHTVLGLELVEDAVRAFFAEHALEPSVERRGPLAIYTAGRITLIAGDLFAVTRDDVEACGGPIDGVYDRAALIALPPDLRRTYLDHLRAIAAPGTPGLLITLDHPSGSGPPFSVPADTVAALYPHAELIETHTSPTGLAGAPVTELVFAVQL